MFSKLIRMYYSARLLPRAIFASLATLHASMHELKERDTLARRSLIKISHGLSDLQQDLNGAHNTTAVAVLALQRRAQAIEDRLAGWQDSISSLTEEVKHQNGTVSQIATTIDLQTKLFPSWLWTLEAAETVRSTLSLLRPYAVRNVSKVRMGRDYDGGYVMLDSFSGITTALSLGISDDVSWDLDIAKRNIRVLQFDPTIPEPPTKHPLFVFEPLRIAPADSNVSISIDTIFRKHVAETDKQVLLKIDIEGSEWDIFASLTDSTLSRCSQIVCEFHSLEQLAEPEFGERARRVFQALTRNHFVCHVHGNNCGNFANVANVPVPQSLEVTFANRAQFEAVETGEIFPTALDRPNEPNRADLYLGQFRFA